MKKVLVKYGKDSCSLRVQAAVSMNNVDPCTNIEKSLIHIIEFLKKLQVMIYNVIPLGIIIKHLHKTIHLYLVSIKFRRKDWGGMCKILTSVKGWRLVKEYFPISLL